MLSGRSYSYTGTYVCISVLYIETFPDLIRGGARDGGSAELGIPEAGDIARSDAARVTMNQFQQFGSRRYGLAAPWVRDRLPLPTGSKSLWRVLRVQWRDRRMIAGTRLYYRPATTCAHLPAEVGTHQPDRRLSLATRRRPPKSKAATASEPTASDRLSRLAYNFLQTEE